MTILFSNNASSTVSGSITTTGTSVALAAGTGVLFPNPTGGDYFVATFYDQATKTINEIVHVTARVGDTCTIVRAQEGTTAKAWSAADIFANLVTAGTLAAFVQAGVGPANTSLVYVGTDVSATPNLIVATTNPVPASYATGMLFNILVKNTNTGPVTMQLNGVAALPALRTDGSQMVGGNITSSQEMTFVYNGVNFNSTVPPIPQQPPQTTFYVRPDGNDNNSGFANTPSAAFATVSGAMWQIQQRYISQNTITIRTADGSYTDGIVAATSYIAAWNIVGNPSNPGNVNIIATSTNPASYPAHAHPGSCVGVWGQGNVTINGFSFQSYGPNATANLGGSLAIYNCNFTAPTSSEGVIIASSGYIGIYGNCSYSGATACSGLFECAGGTMTLAFSDPYSPINLVFNINGTPTFTSGTVVAEATGGVLLDQANLTFTGGVPVGHQYNCASSGGITFSLGNTGQIPGTLPGVVTMPGWTQ